MISARVAEAAAVSEDHPRPRSLLAFARGASLALLALGSGLLLVAGLIGFPRWDPLLPVLVLLGMFFHFLAWSVLLLWTSRDSRRGPSNRGGWLTPFRAFLLSLVAFAASAFATPCLVWRWCSPPSPFFVMFLPVTVFIPYMPTAFAPVVLSHVYIFRGYGRELSPPMSRFVGVGLAWLASVSFIGILGQVAYSMGAFHEMTAALGSDAATLIFRLSFVPFPAGLTAIGYGIAFFAWRWNASRLTTAVPS